MLDVHRLRLLRELSQHGTIAATARVCSLTPSAVSQQLSTLEREIGTPLFVRDGRRLIFTEAAKLLVEHTERVLAELEQAKAGVAALTSTVRGVLRLAAFPTAARALAPTTIARCRAEYPDLRVQLSEREADESVVALKAGHVDVALVYEYNLLPAVRDAGIELEPLIREPLLVALPPDEPGDDADDEPWTEDPIPLHALADQPWIAAGRDDSLRAVLERACGLAGFAPRLDFASSDYTVIFALVQAGLGVSLVPRLALESVATNLRLRAVAGMELTRTVALAVRAGTRRGPAVAAVVDALHRAAQDWDESN